MPRYMNPIGAGGTVTPAFTAITGPGSRMAMTRKIGYGMLGVAIVLLLIGGAGFYLLNSQIQVVEKQEADRRAEVGSSQQIARRYDATMADFDATKLQLQYLEQPEAQDMFVPTMLQQLEQLATSYNCQIKSITPQALLPGSSGAAGASGAAASPAAAAAQPASSGSSSTAAAGPQISYQIMPLSVSMSGSYSQVMHFIYDLTRFKKVVTVKSISLRPESNSASAASGPPPVDADLQLLTYVFQQDVSTEPGATISPTSAAGSTATSATATPTQSNAADFINKPISAALNVQKTSEERVNGAGMQSQPSTPTLPTNPNLGK